MTHEIQIIIISDLKKDLVQFVFRLRGTTSKGKKCFGKGIFVNVPKKQEEKPPVKAFEEDIKEPKVNQYLALEEEREKYNFALGNLDVRFEKLKGKMDKLQELGFMNFERNLTLLLRCKGNLEVVINLLFKDQK